MHQQSLFHQDLTWDRSAHVLAVRWEGFRPTLVCSVPEDTAPLALQFSKSLEFEISAEKECIGIWDHTNHTACPTSVRVSRFSRCDSCGADMIPDQRCIFEPRCRGDSCLVEGHSGEMIAFCSRPHSLYLASYLDKLKIGMTASERVRRRCIEQGADAYIEIASTENRFDARQLEKELSREYGIRQSYNTMEFLRMTVSRIDRDAIHDTLLKTLGSMDTLHTPVPVSIHDLDDYPVSLPLRSVPRETSTSGLHFGKIVGMKGRNLYYESNGLRALNLTDIPSRKIQFNSSSFL